MNAVAIERVAEQKQTINAQRIAELKAAFTTRRVPLTALASLLTDQSLQPRTGDLVLAKVTRIGQHTRLELRTGRKAPLFEGDEVLLCYGDRYSPDQFEAYIPNNLAPCNLVAAGGVAAQVRSRHKARKSATEIQVIGLLADKKGQRINLADWGLRTVQKNNTTYPTTLVAVGTAMNSGKTTTAAYLIKGLRRAGYKVGAAKITGTGAGGDLWLMRDAGANPVFDFCDAGFASTFQLEASQIEAIFTILCAHLARAAVDITVLEIADGLLQQETAHLLSWQGFKTSVDGVLFACNDAMGASAGITWLGQQGLPILALSGPLTASPLAQREAEQATGLSAYSPAQLADPAIATALLQQASISQLLAQAV